MYRVRIFVIRTGKFAPPIGVNQYLKADGIVKIFQNAVGQSHQDGAFISVKHIASVFA